MTGSSAVGTVPAPAGLSRVMLPPTASERGIAVAAVQVVPDGARLRRLAGLLGQGAIAISVGVRYSLGQAGQALEQARHGSHGAATVLRPGDPG